MRFEDWPDRLAAVLERHAALPFAYGMSDCAKLPFEAIEAITGHLPDRFRGDYHDTASARSIMRERGAGNLAELFMLELPEIHPAFARRGDVGIADYPGAIIGGGVIVVGLELVGKGHEGLVRLPRAALSRAFRVE